jgi:hypothetical protein
MIIEGNHIIADNGKILRRISDKMIVGTEYWLGYIYYLGGVKLLEPHLEIPNDFEELTEEDIRQEKLPLYPPLVEKYIRQRYTLSDELAIQRQRDEKAEEFKEYYNYCEWCKIKAKEELELNLETIKYE